MKTKKYYILPLILLCTLKSFSQDDFKDYKFGVNTGITYSNMIGDGIVKNSWINGISYVNNPASDKYIVGKKFGIELEKGVSKIFSWGVALNYEEKGCKIPIVGNADANIRLRYLVIPATIESNFKYFYLQAGLYCGTLLIAKDYGTVLLNGKEYNYNGNFDRYSLFDLGALFSIGINIPFENESVLKFGLKGNWNLNGVERRGMTPKQDKFYNQSYCFEIRYLYKFK